MLTARLSRQPVLRLIAFSIVLAAVITVAVSFATRPAFACPEPPPQPLRHLYVQSDQIVVARIGKREVVKVENPEAAEEEQMSQLKTALHVSSTLKGETKPVIYLSHWMYRDYPDALSSNDAEGKTFLLFLNLNEEDETYSIDDMSYGAKQLSDADLKVYIKRIEELAGILAAEKPSDKEIVEWLVRCAEEPATRWEGAYEFVTSSYLLEYEQERAKAAQAEAEAAKASAENGAEQKAAIVSDAEAASGESESHGEEDEYNPYGAHVKAEFINMLTDEQKYRLTTALVNIERLKDQDTALVQVVKRWDDARLVPYLLSQLRHTDEESPYLTESLMLIVAEKLGDQALIAQVEKFSNMEAEEAAETVEGDGAAEAVAETGEEATEAATDESAETSESEQAALEEAEKVAAAAREQKRKRMLEYFITLAESAVPKPVAEQTVKSPAP